ncbi:MAG: glycosyltransferase family 2 protein [Bacteroidetes bacterium]|nr:glycosyltransferase family 2 protein [Bacteroidota bacterium]
MKKNTKDKLLSICIFTYNRQPYLSQLLLSIENEFRKPELNQSVEIIISDNASTDKTSEIVSYFTQFLPINYHRNKINLGADENLKIAATLAKGKFIWFISDDDIVIHGAINIILQFLQKYDEYSYIYFPRVLANSLGDIIEGLAPEPNIDKTQHFNSGIELLSSNKGRMLGLFLFVSSIIVKRALWEKNIGMYKTKIRGWSHAIPILNIIKNAKCAIIKDPGIICRLNNSNEISSLVWFDNYIKVFLYAKNIGFPEQVCDKKIKDIVSHSERLFLLDKMRGVRSDNIEICLKKLNCQELLIYKTIMVRLSRLPRLILAPIYYIYSIKRKILLHVQYNQ